MDGLMGGSTVRPNPVNPTSPESHTRHARTALGLAGLDHVAIRELHGLGALRAQLAGDDHLRALGALLHHEAEHAVARAADRQAAQQLVLERLGLRLRAEAAGGHLLRKQLHHAVLEAETVKLKGVGVE